MIPDKQKIESIKKNLFHRSVNAITNYESFDWHNYKGVIDTDKINSSQALAIDFWGCLITSDRKNEFTILFFNKSEVYWKIKLVFLDF